MNSRGIGIKNARNNGIMKELRELEKTYYESYEDASDEKKLRWDSLFFNAIEWFSFLVNEKRINDKKIINFFKPSIVQWYENLFLNHMSEEIIENDEYFFEFKKLYKKCDE